MTCWALASRGYHFIAGLPWLDAANVFASHCALFSGIVFISLMGLLLSPIAHRVLHKFHLSDEDLKKSRKAADSRDQGMR